MYWLPLVLAGAFLVNIGLTQAADVTSGGQGGGDFFIYYRATRLWLGGSTPFADAGWLYPTWAAWLFVPFALLPPTVAATTWFFVNVALIAASLLCLAKAFGYDPKSRFFPIVLPLAVIFTPTLWNLYLGNSNALLLLLIASAYLARNRSGILSTFLLAVAGLVKLFPLFLLIWLLVQKRTSAALISAAAFVGLGVVLATPDQYIWLSAVHRSPSTSSLAQPVNQSLAAAITRALTLSPAEGGLWDLPAIVWPAVLAASAVIAGVTVTELIRSKRDAGRDWSLIISASVLLVPLGWVNTMVLLLFPLAWYAKRNLFDKAFSMVAWLLLVAPLLFTRLEQLGVVFPAFLFFSAAFWGASVLWLGILFSKSGSPSRL